MKHFTRKIKEFRKPGHGLIILLEHKNAKLNEKIQAFAFKQTHNPTETNEDIAETTLVNAEHAAQRSRATPTHIRLYLVPPEHNKETTDLSEQAQTLAKPPDLTNLILHASKEKTVELPEYSVPGTNLKHTPEGKDEINLD